MNISSAIIDAERERQNLLLLRQKAACTIGTFIAMSFIFLMLAVEILYCVLNCFVVLIMTSTGPLNSFSIFSPFSSSFFFWVCVCGPIGTKSIHFLHQNTFLYYNTFLHYDTFLHQNSFLFNTSFMCTPLFFPSHILSQVVHIVIIDFIRL